jgi:hypothetical protein
MRSISIERYIIASLICAGLASTMVSARAQSPAAAPPAARGPARASASTTRPDANLGQLMKGILFTNANVIFAAQSTNPADVTPAKDPALATDPLANAYGKWEAVENSGLALAESARLLTVPGRMCANGRPVPIANPDWAKFVQGLREAGLKAYKAAQSKDQDKILDAADTMTTACANCHEKYREKANLADRCK